MIIINSFRGLALILLVIILIIKEIPFKNLFKDLMIQFYMALICILFLLLVDNIFGFILSICLLTLYFRIYTSELNLKNNNNDQYKSITDKDIETGINTNIDTNTEKCIMDQVESKIIIPVKINNNETDCLVPYITEENLLSAQSNIINPEGYNKEYYGVDKGIYKEDVYGSQGLDNKNIHIRGYDVNNSYLGKMQYEII
jgi:Ca2+/Na+ antiporter